MIFCNITDNVFDTGLVQIYIMVLDQLEYVGDKMQEYVGFSLFMFPYSNEINAKCFVCNAKPPPPTKLKEFQTEIKSYINDTKTQMRDFVVDTNNEYNKYTSNIL
jgi:hypothetical protein